MDHFKLLASKTSECILLLWSNPITVLSEATLYYTSILSSNILHQTISISPLSTCLFNWSSDEISDLFRYWFHGHILLDYVGICSRCLHSSTWLDLAPSLGVFTVQDCEDCKLFPKRDQHTRWFLSTRFANARRLEASNAATEKGRCERDILAGDAVSCRDFTSLSTDFDADARSIARLYVVYWISTIGFSSTRRMTTCGH